MESVKALEEVYIRLMESDLAFVCTIFRDGVLEAPVQFPLAVPAAAEENTERELVLRPSRHAVQAARGEV
jgi:hypothetical protein